MTDFKKRQRRFIFYEAVNKSHAIQVRSFISIRHSCDWGGVMRECHLSCVTFCGLQQCVVLMSGRGVSQHWSCWPVWPYWLSALRHRERTISSDWELAAAACCTLLNSVYSMYTRTTYHTARRWPFVYFFPKYLLPFKAKCFLSNLFC